MLRDVLPADSVWNRSGGPSQARSAIRSFIHFLERRLGAEFVYDQARLGFESPELAEMLGLAERLRAAGVIRSYGRSPGLPDDPPLAHWRIECANAARTWTAGCTVDDDRLALTMALAEAIERYSWFEDASPFAAAQQATVAHMRAHRALLPERFAGFSEKQRTGHPRLGFTEASSFAWTKGWSWTDTGEVWIPVQAVRGVHVNEPLIRSAITTGLATHHVRERALLSGALEVIERDAYMITWLNQLTPPRLDLDALAAARPALAKLVARCRRYRFEPHVVRLVTDAPTYALLAVLEDSTGALPVFSLGLKAGQDPAQAAERALIEALRGHLGGRHQALQAASQERTAHKVGHYDRLGYWAQPGKAEKLSFLTAGPIEAAAEPWVGEDDAAHLARIIRWCRERGYALASVDLSGVRANLPGWHILFTVIPELQPLHYAEQLPYAGGARLADVPERLGFRPRPPFLAEPHPFA